MMCSADDHHDGILVTSGSGISEYGDDAEKKKKKGLLTRLSFHRKSDH